VSGWEIEVRDHEEPHDLARAFLAVLEATRVAGKGLAGVPVLVEAEADLPPGGGLGCSAALGVAVARALDPSANDVQIAERATAWERVFHGNPSGIDTAVAASGGFVRFKRGEGEGASRAPNVIEPVRARGSLLFCVGHSGIASSTKTMVESVAQLRARRPEVVEKAFEGIRVLVENARLALEAGDRFALGRLMDLNQMLLSGLFVSSPEIERMCGLARDAGALGAKLTGAGGGGCVLALVPNSLTAEKVLEAWKADGFDGFATKVVAAAPPAVVINETAP
jgi:mevalonate kinase